MNNVRSNLFRIIDSAIESVKPASLFKQISYSNQKLLIREKTFELSKYKRVFVVGAGKAVGFMALELERLLSRRITAGFVIVKYGHKADCKFITNFEAGHPIIDENSIFGTRKILEICSNASTDDLVIVLVSGGGSSLFELLPDQISLKDYQILNEELIKSGADIKEINSIRKFISKVKGGKLLDFIHPASTIALILSDVVGNDLEFIASGPTIKSKNVTISEIKKIVLKYDLQDKLPSSIKKFVETKSETLETENKKTIVSNILIGSNETAVKAATLEAERLGYHTTVIDSKVNCDANILAEQIHNIFLKNYKSKEKLCFVWSGETTVKVKGKGKGGRNQHLALVLLDLIKDESTNYQFASIGTDGTDGNTNSAGAFISREIYKKSKTKGLSIKDYLSRFDSNNFFKKCDGIIKTGPTGTNVMDIMILMIN